MKDFPEWERANTWARERWGSRVHAVNFRSTGRYIVSLDGPPIRCEPHVVLVNGSSVHEEGSQHKSAADE